VVGGGAAASVVVVVGGSVAGGFVAAELLAVGELPPPHEYRATANRTADVRFISTTSRRESPWVTRRERIRKRQNMSRRSAVPPFR
jgi:hypothetical protein